MTLSTSLPSLLFLHLQQEGGEPCAICGQLDFVLLWTEALPQPLLGARRGYIQPRESLPFRWPPSPWVVDPKGPIEAGPWTYETLAVEHCMALEFLCPAMAAAAGRKLRGLLGTLPMGEAGTLHRTLPPGPSGTPGWQAGHIQLPRVPPLAPVGGPAESSVLVTVKDTPHAGAGPQEGGIQGRASHTRWEAEAECQDPATWCPLRPAGQAAHRPGPPAGRGGGGAGPGLLRPA